MNRKSSRREKNESRPKQDGFYWEKSALLSTVSDTVTTIRLTVAESARRDGRRSPITLPRQSS
ncbi:Uncharacterised protein [Plesiomonas shigelloides]|jgi:hypothetical protein|nr:Uncharacterised protein [Plesiomonas shigelloides]